MPRRLPTLTALLIALLLAACGATTQHPARRSVAGAILQTTSHPRPRAQLPTREKCPADRATMGCDAGASPYNYAAAPTGSRPAAVGVDSRTFPDVSSYQGCGIQWSQVPVRGAVVKAWEYQADACLAHNAASLTAAHKLWTMYDFVRYCTATGFVALYNRYRPPLPPVIDEEVPAAAGCTAPLAAQIHRDTYNHAWPVEYTGPGTEQPGAGADSLALWVASYGASHAPCLWRCAVAWQYASPPYEYVYIRGLGYGDVNQDLGMLELTTRPTPPKLICYGPHSRAGAACRAIRAHVARDRRAAAASLRVLEPLQRTLAADRCRRPYRRRVCVHAGGRADLFATRARYFTARADELTRQHT